MVDKQGFQTVKQYAEHRKVSQQTVYKHVRNGKITEKSWKQGKRGYLIHQEKADKDLSENLDRIHNPGRHKEPMPETWFYRGQDRDTAERIQIQEQAADIASENEEPGPGGYLVPLPIWDIHYIAALFHLDPSRVEIERFSNTEWRLMVHNLDNETGEPCPWAVDLTFNLNPEQAEG